MNLVLSLIDDACHCPMSFDIMVDNQRPSKLKACAEAKALDASFDTSVRQKPFDLAQCSVSAYGAVL
jgi:hypothetical protein